MAALLNDRKGDVTVPMTVLVTAVAVLTAGFILMWAVGKWNATASEKDAEVLCQTSMAWRQSAALQVGENDVKVSPILCKNIEKKITTKQDPQQVIADKMAKCWQMFGAGKYVSNVFDAESFTGSDSTCFSCYTLKVKDLPENQHISPDELERYWRTTSYPRNQDLTYLQYFQGAGEGVGYVLTLLPPEGIQENHAYEIIYKAKKTDNTIAGKVLTIGGATLALGAVTVGVFATGGTILLVAGGAAAAGGITLQAQDFYNTFFTEQTNVDGLVLVDLEDSYVHKALQQYCEFTSGVGEGE